MAKGKRLALFTFIDAFGWEIMKQHSFMDDLLVHKQPLGTIFGYSSTCDPTIISGKMPRDHGHFSFFYYNPPESPFKAAHLLGYFPKFLTRRGRVRRIMSRVLKKYYGFTGYFQIYNMPFDKIHYFDYSEKRDLYQPGGMNSGVPTIFDHLRDNNIPFYLSEWWKPEEHNIATLKCDIEQEKIVFAYLYMAAMDATLHEDGKASPRVDAKIAWYEQQMQDIIKLAHQHYEDVHLYVFTDHGMTDTFENCALIPQITSLGFKFGVDYAAVYDSTMARFWFFNNSAKQAIIEALKKEKRGDILSDETLAKWGCDFPTPMYGELFFLMKPGILLCPSFLGETTLAGMHGYDPHDKDSVAMLCSNVTPDPPAKGLEDLYAIMKREADEAVLLTPHVRQGGIRGGVMKPNIILRSYNDMPLISETLAMIGKQDIEFVLISMDNESSDGTTEEIAKYSNKIINIPKGSYVPGKVLNQAMEASDGEFVVFINSDCTPQNSDWLKNLLKGFHSDDIAAVFGRQIPRPDCKPLYAKDTEATFGDGELQKYWKHCFSMASSAIRRSVWEKMKFNEDIQYSEDIEWTWRVRQAGYKVQYVADSIVAHSHNYTLKQWHKRQYGEGKAEAVIFDWTPWETSLLRYSILPFGRQLFSDWKYSLRHFALGSIIYSPFMRMAQMLGRRKGFKDGQQT